MNIASDPYILVPSQRCIGWLTAHTRPMGHTHAAAAKTGVKVEIAPQCTSPHTSQSFAADCQPPRVELEFVKPITVSSHPRRPNSISEVVDVQVNGWQHTHGSPSRAVTSPPPTNHSLRLGASTWIDGRHSRIQLRCCRRTVAVRETLEVQLSRLA